MKCPKCRRELLPVTKEAYIKACSYPTHPDWARWQAVINMERNLIGFTPLNTSLWITDLVDEQLLGESDTTGVYWLPRQGNEELEVELLKLETTLIKPKQR